MDYLLPEAAELRFLLTIDGEEIEMMVIDDKGFTVRGKRIEHDDKETMLVYNALKDWLTAHGAL